MVYRLLTDLTVGVHFAFLIFVVAGGFLARRHRWLVIPHLVAAAWGVYVEVTPGLICPLTPLENAFAVRAGEAGYQGSFIEHYLVPIIYPEGLTRVAQWGLAALVVAVNAAAYSHRGAGRTRGGDVVNEASEKAKRLPDPPPSGSRDRTFVVAGAALFLVSTAFPLFASIRSPQAPARWLGVADVTLALLVVLAGMAISLRKPVGFEGRVVVSAFEIYRTGANLFLVLLVLFFAVGDLIQWSILLPGLAWRAWIFAWVLPSALALWRMSAK